MKEGSGDSGPSDPASDQIKSDQAGHQAGNIVSDNYVPAVKYRQHTCWLPPKTVLHFSACVSGFRFTQIAYNAPFGVGYRLYRQTGIFDQYHIGKPVVGLDLLQRHG